MGNSATSYDSVKEGPWLVTAPKPQSVRLRVSELISMPENEDWCSLPTDTVWECCRQKNVGALTTGLRTAAFCATSSKYFMNTSSSTEEVSQMREVTLESTLRLVVQPARSDTSSDRNPMGSSFAPLLT